MAKQGSKYPGSAWAVLSCPHGVDIPETSKLYNNYQLVKPHGIDAYAYQKILLSAGAGVDQCVSCGLCMKRCPQGLKNPYLLKQVHQEFMELFNARVRARDVQ
jgi:predicted aldo/keto reductase-like oxidoreductase